MLQTYLTRQKEEREIYSPINVPFLVKKALYVVKSIPQPTISPATPHLEKKIERRRDGAYYQKVDHIERHFYRQIEHVHRPHNNPKN